MENFKPFVNSWGGGSFGRPEVKKESRVPKMIFGCFDPRGAEIIARKLKELKDKKKEFKWGVQKDHKCEVKENVPCYVTPRSYCQVVFDMRYINEEKIVCKPIKIQKECHPFKVEFPLRGGSKNVKNFDPPQFRKKNKEKKYKKKYYPRGLQEKLNSLRSQMDKYVSLLGMGKPKTDITRKNGKFGCMISLINGKFEDEVSVDHIYYSAREAEIACLEDVIQNCAEDYEELLRKQKDEEISNKNKKDLIQFEDEKLKEEEAIRCYFKKMEYDKVSFTYDIGDSSCNVTVLIDGMSLFGWGDNYQVAFQDLWLKIKSIFDPDIPFEEGDLLKLCIEKGYPDPSITTYDLSVGDDLSFVSEVKVGNLRVVSDSVESKNRSREIAVKRMIQKVRKNRYYEDVVDFRKEVYYKDDQILDKIVDEEGYSYSDGENGDIDYENYEVF